MAEIRIDDPELYERKKIDEEGRIYLGRDWAGKNVRIVVEDCEDEPKEVDDREADDSE